MILKEAARMQSNITSVLQNFSDSFYSNNPMSAINMPRTGSYSN